MKSSGSAERRDGGAYKALTALRKGISGSYVILFFPTLTDVCLSHFSDTVNECRAEIYLIEQHSHGLWPEAEKKKNNEKATGLLTFQTAWTTTHFLCDLLKFRGESLRLTNGNKTASRQTSLANWRPPQAVSHTNLTSPACRFACNKLMYM